MFDAAMPASLGDIDGADQVAVDMARGFCGDWPTLACAARGVARSGVNAERRGLAYLRQSARCV